MGGKSGGSDAAEAARRDELRRQKRIREGTKRINSIFNGGVFGTDRMGSDAVFDPSATYYTAMGDVWNPNSLSPSEALSIWGRNPGGSFSVADAFKRAVADGKLFAGTETRSGFNDEFFADRRKSFLDYATPQLNEQYGDAQEELTFSLARGGNLNSSTRGDQASELQKLFDLNKQQIADRALSYENQARNAVEDARSGLITTLNATGDAEGAANSALTRAVALSQPAEYSPLGQLFVDFTSGLGAQAAQERAAAASGGLYRSPFNIGLFGNTDRVQVR